MARKKFKTVAGYLRSAGGDFYYAQERAKHAGAPVTPDEEGQRRILNNLLPQIGIAGQIGPPKSRSMSSRGCAWRLRTRSGQRISTHACNGWAGALGLAQGPLAHRRWRLASPSLVAERVLPERSMTRLKNSPGSEQSASTRPRRPFEHGEAGPRPNNHVGLQPR